LTASLPAIANPGLTSGYYNPIAKDVLFDQLAGIMVAFIWNYAASSRLFWNTP
jgi:dolichol-phosphate mannosyltransferase